MRVLAMCSVVVNSYPAVPPPPPVLSAVNHSLPLVLSVQSAIACNALFILAKHTYIHTRIHIHIGLHTDSYTSRLIATRIDL